MEAKEPLKGQLYHREKSQRYLYVLDEEIGAVYCFKRKVNQIRSKVLILSGCEFLDYPSKV
jgi:Leucine-rich repeat (LRR) protein